MAEDLEKFLLRDIALFIENEKETEFEYSLKNIEVKFIHLIYSKEFLIN